MRIVRQLAIDGPAKGQVFKRPISEASVYLPWQTEKVETTPGVIVHGKIITYLPYTHYIFGQRVTVLALHATSDDVVVAALLAYAIRKLAKETEE